MTQPVLAQYVAFRNTRFLFLPDEPSHRIGNGALFDNVNHLMANHSFAYLNRTIGECDMQWGLWRGGRKISEVKEVVFTNEFVNLNTGHAMTISQAYSAERKEEVSK